MQKNRSSRIVVTDGLSVAGAPASEAEVRSVARDGYRSIVDLRSLGEPVSGLAPQLERRIAAESGLDYRSCPVSLSSLGAQAMRDLHLALWSAEAPTLVHCGSGRRAAVCVLIHLGCQAGWSGAECARFAAARGIDLLQMPRLREFLDRYLEQNSYRLGAGDEAASTYQI